MSSPRSMPSSGTAGGEHERCRHRKRRPPKDESPPCQMAKMSPGSPVEGEVREHVQRTRAHHGRDDDPDEDRRQPVDPESPLFEPPFEVDVGEPEGEGEADPIGVDLEGPMWNATGIGFIGRVAPPSSMDPIAPG